MNTNNIFICYSKTGNELLLYKDSNKYIDLLKKSIYPIENIDFSTMIFASNSLRLRKNMSNDGIKNKYLKDREKMVETQRFIVGCVTEVTNLEETYTGSVFDLCRHYAWESVPKYNSLFVSSISIFQRDKSYKIYKNILNNKKYIFFTGEDFSKKMILNNGIEYVDLFSKNLQDICNKTIVDKKYVYEVANKIKQKSLTMYQ